MRISIVNVQVSSYMVVLLIGQTACYHYLHEGQLHRDLLENYDRAIRPSQAAEHPVLVKIYPTVIRIGGLDEGKSMLETTTSLSMTWFDSRFKWHPVDYGDITQTHVALDKLWKPDIAPSNGLSMPHDAVTMAAVSSSGTVAAVLLQTTSSYCDLDLTAFPEDTQTCDILFGSWIYSYSQLAMEFWDGDRFYKEIAADGADPDTGRQWVVEGGQAIATVYNVTQDCCPDDPFVQMRIRLKLVRQSGFLSQILACQLIVFLLLVPLQFVLPPSSQERILYGLLVLIGDLLLMHSLLQFLPRSSSASTHIGCKYLANFCLALVALVLSSLVTWIWYQQVKGRQMSGTIQRFLQCLRHCFRHAGGENPKGKSLLPTDEPADNDNNVELDTFRQIHEQNGNTGPGGPSIPADKEVPSIALTALAASLQETNRILREFRIRFKEKEVRNQGNSDWNDLAALLNRVCFLVLCFIVLVIIIISVTVV